MEPVYVEGEISNFTHHGSGHFYFSLKDDQSQLRCVMFRRANANLGFTPKSGQKVVAYGNISVYEPRGEYQLIVASMRPSGLGELMLALQALKEKLAAEGLFDQARKKPIPAFPSRVGVVTSPTGVAIRDIIRVVSERFPAVELVLAPARVQGEGAAAEIAAAIGRLERYGRLDCVIVGRGGGSMEDLWAFNEETVVRAIAAARLPIISAVGHEIDVTLADLAADLRAATPSAAAEIVTPDRREVRDRLNAARQRLTRSLAGAVEIRRERLRNLASRYGFRRPSDAVARERQRLDDFHKDLIRGAGLALTLNRRRLDALLGRLGALDPRNVLARGYSITQLKTDNRVVSRSDQLEPGADIRIAFHRGWAEASVTGTGDDSGGADDRKTRGGEE